VIGLHWGVDVDAVREVIESGSNRGASTITQQVAKNVFLWHGRSFVRKGLEAGFAVAIEAAWGKRRILEVYLNVAEFERSASRPSAFVKKRARGIANGAQTIAKDGRADCFEGVDGG